MGNWPEGGLGEMYRLIASLPTQLSASADLDGLPAIAPWPGPGRIVLCGMGGSAIAGDLLQPLLVAGQPSLTVWRDYDLPPWASAGDLVICCSYSGNTEETLSAVAAAGALGCRRIAVTSGGELAKLAADDGFPAVILPGGLPPRASLGYGLGALLRVLGRLGVVADAASEIDLAAAVLQDANASRRDPMHGAAGPLPDAESNISAGRLAEVLADRIPVIYTAGREAHGVGMRWKAQINENSKMPALVVAFPELNHNDIVGWRLSPEARERFVLIILRGADDNERIARRVAITKELMAAEFTAIHEIRAKGKTSLARVLSLVQYGDYLSCHLARLTGVDPVPVDRITKLKNALG